ncbi:jg10371 [Pararge aegeria aegeria]|uniref:Jg10371 protein n=1 Tax=Pararge aegeria aegeria TaxID=348720 RepID=A0A8S4QGF0_9NEOP|nr:jg10371 [Pararge aegeria aegeria]
MWEDDAVGLGVGLGVGLDADTDEELDSLDVSGIGVKVLGDAAYYDAVFDDLMHECKNNAPGARLSARLRKTLERYGCGCTCPEVSFRYCLPSANIEGPTL